MEMIGVMIIAAAGTVRGKKDFQVRWDAHGSKLDRIFPDPARSSYTNFLTFLIISTNGYRGFVYISAPDHLLTGIPLSYFPIKNGEF